MDKIENIRNKAVKDGYEKYSSKTLNRSTAKSILTASSFKGTSPRVALGTIRAKLSSERKTDATTSTLNTTSIRRSPLPPRATTSLGSPVRLANSREVKEPRNSSPLNFQGEGPRGHSSMTHKKLQLRSQTSTTRLGTKETATNSIKLGSPSARKTIRIKELDSGRSSKQVEPFHFSTFPSKKPPARASIIPKSLDVTHSPFERGSIPSSPVYPISPSSVIITQPPHHSQIQTRVDDSTFSDWEIVDWPWVTPYAPSTGLNMGLSFPKLQDTFPDFRIHEDQYHSEFWRRDSHLPPVKGKPRERKNQRVSTDVSRSSDGFKDSNSQFYTGGKVFEDEIRKKLNPAYRVPARRHDQISCASKMVEPDPAIVSRGPALSISSMHCLSGKPGYMEITAVTKQIQAQKESSQKILAKNLVEFTKAISQMKKKDRKLVEVFLEALRNIGTEEEDLEGIPFEAGLNIAKINNEYQVPPGMSAQRRLNPTAPAFSVDVKHFVEDTKSEGASVEPVSRSRVLEMLQQKKAAKANVHIITRQPLQEIKAADQNSQSITDSQEQISRAENSQIGASVSHMSTAIHVPVSKNACSSEKLRVSTKPKAKPLWVKNAVSAAKKLSQVTKTEPATIENTIETWADEVLLPPIQYPFPELILSVSSGVYPDNIPDDKGPGRVAQAMDPQWAKRRLDSFREKYPLTGMIAKCGGPTDQLAIPFSKKFASDIQQRLEFVLFQQKEKKALDKLIEELGSGTPFF